MQLRFEFRQTPMEHPGEPVLADCMRPSSLVPAQLEFSPRDENSAPDTTDPFYWGLLERCRAYAHDYAEAAKEKDLRAQQYLKIVFGHGRAIS